MSEILVLAEHRDGALREVTLEMLSLVRSLGASHDLPTTVVIL